MIEPLRTRKFWLQLFVKQYEVAHLIALLRAVHWVVLALALFVCLLLALLHPQDGTYALLIGLIGISVVVRFVWFHRGRTLEVTSWQKAQENALLFQATLEATLQHIGLLSPEGAIWEVNEATLTFMGVKRAQVLNKFVWDTSLWQHAPEERKKLQRAVQRAAAGELVRYESAVVGKNGVKAVIELCLHAVYDPRGQIKFITIEGWDITDRKKAEEQLHFQTRLLEQITDAVITTDLDFRVMTWNKGAETLYGWQEAEVSGQPLNALFRPYFPNSSQEHMERSYQNKGQWQGEAVHQRKDCSWCFVSSSFTLMRDSQGKPIRCIVINRDIGGQKEDEYRYHELFEAAPIMYVVTHHGNGNPIITQSNRLFAQNMGYQREELVGRPLVDFLYRDPQANHRADDDEISLRGKIGHEEQILITRTGERIETMLHTIPHTDSLGNITGTLSMYVNITGRKQAERQVQEYADLLEQRVIERTWQLAQSEEVLRHRTRILATILDSMADGVIVADELGQFLLFNAAATQIIGMGITNTPPEAWASMYGVYLPDKITLCPPAQNPLIRAISGEAVDLQELYIHNDQVPQGLWIEANARPLQNDVAHFSQGGVVVFRDITKTKQTAEALQQQTLALQEQNAELDAFAHSVAHDLKNPLSHITGYAELLKSEYREMTEAEQQKALDYIVISGFKMNTIVQELLLLASVRKEDVELEPVNMNDVVSEAILRLYTLIEQGQAQIIVPESWPLALSYGPWLEEVWANYLSNALQYGGIPPHIELGYTVQADSRVAYWVKDNGMGLTPEQKARMFVQFTRLDRGRAKGHGLGLSIVQRILAKLGGEVFVESESGQGSTFGFILPAFPLNITGAT